MTSIHQSEVRSLASIQTEIEEKNGSNKDCNNIDPDLGLEDDVSEQSKNMDGGFGWFVVLGTFMVQVTSFGIASSWGVLQDHLDIKVYRDKINNSQFQLSFVGTILEIFVNLMGPVAQIISSRFGSRTVLIIGTLLATAGLELASISTQVWQLYLTQGVMFGTGASLLFVTAVGITPLWFDKKRGLALGIATSGSGIGGLVFPFVISAINERINVQWSFRILGLICLFCDAIACICLREKHKMTGRTKIVTLREIFHLSIFKDKNFIIWTCGSVISLMGYFVPYFFVPSYATHIGLSSSQGSAMIAIMSSCNFVGRILVGFIGDRIGRLNADIIFTFLCAFTSFFLWTFAKSYAMLAAYSALFGLFCGSYFALMAPITAAILKPEQFMTGLSTIMIFSIISNLGIVVASAIETNIAAEPYLTYKMFTGVTYLVGGVILIILKFNLKGGFFSKF